MNRSGLVAMLAVAATCMPLPLLLGCRSGSGASLAPRVLTSSELQAVEADPLGSIKNPVRCDGVEGEMCYMIQLRCPSRQRPKIEGRFSILERSPYGTIVDEYILRCPDWEEPRSVFMDMYHRGYVEERPAQGFNMAAPE